MPSAVPDFYLEDGEGETPSDEEDEATGGLNRRPSADHNDQSSLVRQASLGKRTKPTLTTIKSAESIGSPAKRPYMPSLQSPPQIVTPKVSRSRLRDSSVLFDDSSPSSEELSMKFGDTRNNEFPSYQRYVITRAHLNVAEVLGHLSIRKIVNIVDEELSMLKFPTPFPTTLQMQQIRPLFFLLVALVRSMRT
jgi:hypothetical protein